MLGVRVSSRVSKGKAFSASYGLANRASLTAVNMKLQFTQWFPNPSLRRSSPEQKQLCSVEHSICPTAAGL